MNWQRQVTAISSVWKMNPASIIFYKSSANRIRCVKPHCRSCSFVNEIRDYLKQRRLPSHFDFLPPQAPLIPSLRDKTGRKHLTPAGIHKILSAFFDQMLSDLEADDQAEKRLTGKLLNASTHWLRHSYGSYLANDKQVPLTYIRDELGHANISTTSLYLNSDAKQRQKVVSDAFIGM